MEKKVKWSGAWGEVDSSKSKAPNDLYAPWQDMGMHKKMQRDDGDSWELVESKHNNQPWWDIASLLHEGAQREPQAIKNPKVVRRVWGTLWVFELIILIQVPLIRAEAAHEEEHHAHANVGENYTHPNLIGQWVQKRKHSGFGLLRLLNHYGDTQAHKGLREVYHFLPNQRYGERSHGYVSSLQK